MSHPKVDLPETIQPPLADAVIAMTFDNDQDVLSWFALLEETHAEHEAAGSPEWTVLRARITEAAAGIPFDAMSVEYFLDVVESGGQATTVAELVALRDSLPDVYWTVYWWRYGEDSAADATADPMGWVDGTTASSLAAAWGETWRESLAAQLEARWGAGWEQHPDDHKAHWLGDLLPELLGGTEQAAAEELTPEQYEQALRAMAVESVQEAIAEIPDAEHLSPAAVEGMVQRVLAELRAE
jgi:hypothetical protein